MGIAGQVGWMVMLVAATPCFASNTGSYRIEAHVPLTCSVDFVPSPGVPNAGAALGKLTEYCNSPSGYHVHMLYPAGAYDGVTVRINGSAIVLDGSGRSLIDVAYGASSRRVEVVATRQGPANLDRALVSFAIEPR
jgi:hypothetical protein